MNKLEVFTLNAVPYGALRCVAFRCVVVRCGIRSGVNEPLDRCHTCNFVAEHETSDKVVRQSCTPAILSRNFIARQSCSVQLYILHTAHCKFAA